MSERKTPEWGRTAIEAEQATTLGGLAVVHGTVPMVIPSGGNHVRQTALRVPRTAFSRRPTTLISIYSETTPGDPYALYDLTWVLDVGFWHFCKVSAQATNNARDEVYYCDYFLVGQ